MDISKIHFSGELPLEGTNNVRDLGGYYCDLGKGKITKYHKFIRSSGLSYITKKDIDFLISYGVKDVLDLRSQEEAEAMPNKLKDIEGITYYNIPLSIEDMVADITKEEKNFNMQEGYIKRIESKHIIKGIVEYIADNINGNFLFHCTAGKDRTGLVASILLGLCKVSRSDIKANYEVSHTYMRENKDFMNAYQRGKSKVFLSKSIYMESVYDYIINTYGTYKTYLKECGIKEEKLNKIIKYFTTDI